MVDRADRELGRDQLSGPFALLNTEGPICLDEPGQYRALVSVARGQGEIALQVFQAE
jgi:hypothetical protein